MAQDTSPTAAPKHPAEPERRTRLSPKKLLLSKWTAVAPVNREKHFLVVELVLPEPPTGPLEQVVLEAVHSKRVIQLPWQALRDPRHWRQGWV